jgi:hypothetical protein
MIASAYELHPVQLVIDIAAQDEVDYFISPNVVNFDSTDCYQNSPHQKFSKQKKKKEKKMENLLHIQIA